MLVLLLTVLLGACDTGTRDEQVASPAGERITRDEQGPSLPLWATAEEKAAAEQGLNGSGMPAARTPPPKVFRLPSEYEPIRAVVVTWRSARDTLQAIAQAAVAAGAEVWAVDGPSSLAGVPPTKYRVFPTGSDSVWVRDYGPVGIVEQSGTLAMVDAAYGYAPSGFRMKDDAVPCKMAEVAGVNCYSTTLQFHGGNFMVDSKGNAFFTTRLYEQNSMSRDEVHQQLRDYFGAKSMHALEYAKLGEVPADGTGHIDTFVKLVSDCRVIVAQTQDEPFRTATDAAAKHFSNLDCPEGRKYEVFRVDGWEEAGTWYTYVNSLIVNSTVIIPHYAKGDNEKAHRDYAAAMPGYTIVGVNSDEAIRRGGAVHCMTQTIPLTAAQP